VTAVATFGSLAAVGLSLEALLNACIDEELTRDPQAFQRRPTARLVRSDDFERGTDTNAASLIQGATLSVFCYRVDVNRTMRAAWSGVAAHDGEIHLPVDLHFLITAWDSDAQAELRMLGFAMQCLERHPVMSGPRLHPSGGWAAGEAIQLVNEDLLSDDVQGTFDTLPTDYRLSVSYVARVTRIDAPDEPDHPDVVTVVSGTTQSTVGAP
jgi:hypothetical protein